jgi:hypothetical protein
MHRRQERAPRDRRARDTSEPPHEPHRVRDYQGRPAPIARTAATSRGTIRKRDGHWLVWDPNHAHRGLGRVTCLKGGGLTVELRPVGIADGFGAVTVAGALVSEGVAGGSSANQRRLTLTFGRNGERMNCRHEVFDDPGANIWITWTQVVAR